MGLHSLAHGSPFIITFPGRHAAAAAAAAIHIHPFETNPMQTHSRELMAHLSRTSRVCRQRPHFSSPLDPVRSHMPRRTLHSGSLVCSCLRIVRTIHHTFIAERFHPFHRAHKNNAYKHTNTHTHRRLSQPAFGRAIIHF